MSGFPFGGPPQMPPRSPPRAAPRHQRAIPSHAQITAHIRAIDALIDTNLQGGRDLERQLLHLHKIGRKYGNILGNLLMDSGAGDMVLRLYRNFSTNARIIAIANQIVRYLSGNMYRFFQAGAGQLVLKSMEDHKGDKKVQAGGCYAIRSLARNRANARQLVSNTYEVVHVIKQAMRFHLDDADTQKAAASAIWCLCIYEEANEVLWKQGIASHVIESLRYHTHIAKVQEYGIQVLKMFNCFYSVVRLGGAQVMVDALKNHTRVNYVVTPTLKGIRQFIQYQSNAEVLNNLDAPYYVVRAVQSLSRDEKILFNGLGVIYQMAHWENLKRSLIRNNVARVFSDVIHTANLNRTQEQSIFSHCLVCIKKFSDEEANVRQFLGLGLHAAVSRACGTLLKQNNKADSGACLDILIEFCTTLVEARQPIAAEALMLVNDIDQLFSYEEIGTKAARLKDMLS